MLFQLWEKEIPGPKEHEVFFDEEGNAQLQRRDIEKKSAFLAGTTGHTFLSDNPDFIEVLTGELG